MNPRNRLAAIVAAATVFNIPLSIPVRGNEPQRLDDELVFDGWISLFDGQTLHGWKQEVDGNWRVANGTITVSEGEVGLLRTTSQFSDYQLYLEFSADADTNSGVFIRTSPKPRNPAADCYEINIAPADNPFPTASLVARKRADSKVVTHDWHTLEITADSGSIQISLDGETVTDFDDPNPLGRGYIGLQHNSGRVAFRNVRLRPLHLKSLFNGENLDGWRHHPDSQSEFSVTESGELNVKNGRGQLETDQSFGDFVLQLDCIAHGDGLNSGIFFRCIPGEFMMGYESQIENRFKDGDPNQPLDCGTGGIFRRQDARRVVARDRQWFSKTLVVVGPRIAVWVNGYQVTDWSDQRREHENPRKGLRLIPGSIIIQGHDPTTDLSLRNLRAAELPERNY